MPLDAEEMIQLLLKTNKEQEQTITDLRANHKGSAQYHCKPE